VGSEVKPAISSRAATTRSVGSLVTASRELRISMGGDACFVHIILDGDGLLSGVNVEQR